MPTTSQILTPTGGSHRGRAGRSSLFRVSLPTAAVVVAVLIVVLTVVDEALALLTHGPAANLVSLVDQLGLTLPFAAVGFVVARRQPHNPIGWVLLASVICLVLDTGGTNYSVVDFQLRHGSLPFGWLAVALGFLWIPWLVLMALPVLLFPAGRVPTPRWRWSLVAYLIALGVGTIFPLAVGAVIGLTPHLHLLADGSPTTSNLRQPWSTAYQAAILCAVFALALWLTWTIRLVASYRNSRGDSRQQLKWLMGGATITVVVLVVVLVLSAVVPSNGASGAWDLWVNDLLPLGLAALPVGMGVAILKYRLYDVDRLISRTLSYAIVTGILAGVYVGLVTVATRVLPFSSPLGVAASTLAAVALFNPLRRRVQRVVDRRFNRAKYNADAMVSAFANRVRDDVDLEIVSSEFLRAVRASVEPTHVSLWMRPTEFGSPSG
ncbi:MAG: hypothetical protein WB020_10325 [Candidatus Dormiibacterota bacterium]